MRYLLSIALALVATLSMATQSLTEVRFDRPLEFRRFGSFESLAAFNAVKPYTLTASYQWVSGSNLSSLRLRGYQANEGGAFEYRLGLSRLDVDTLPSVEDWGYSLGVGFQSAVPLAENLSWSADLDFVRDAFGGNSYSPSATLSYALPKQSGIQSYFDVTLGYDFIDPDGGDNEDAPSLSAALVLESEQGFGLQYVYTAPSRIQDYSYSILGTYKIPNAKGIKAIVGFRRDDVKYVGLSFQF